MDENSQTSQGRTRRKGSAVQGSASGDEPVAKTFEHKPTAKENTDEKLDEMAQQLSEMHGYISSVGVKRHRMKINQPIENAISQMSQAMTSLNKYLKERQAEGVFGQD